MLDFVPPPERCRSGWSGMIDRICVPGRGTARGGNWWGVIAALVLAGMISGTGIGVAEGRIEGVGDILSRSASDTFSHDRHERLACMTCHLSSSGSMLTFQPPRGCQICHHSDEAQKGCAACHGPGKVPDAIEVHIAIAVPNEVARERPVAFQHAWHDALPCTACHGKRVTMEPADSVQTCRGCHVKHHESGRTCATCHRTESITQPHSLPVQAHVACDRCHSTAAIAPLTPTRTFCLVCHDPSVDHHPERECVACHLQASPEDYRARLLKH
jgi:hypothetical protein